jgi:hypothetical protein
MPVLVDGTLPLSSPSSHASTFILGHFEQLDKFQTLKLIKRSVCVGLWTRKWSFNHGCPFASPAAGRISLFAQTFFITNRNIKI